VTIIYQYLYNNLILILLIINIFTIFVFKFISYKGTMDKNDFNNFSIIGFHEGGVNQIDIHEGGEFIISSGADDKMIMWGVNFIDLKNKNITGKFINEHNQVKIFLNNKIIHFALINFDEFVTGTLTRYKIDNNSMVFRYNFKDDELNELYNYEFDLAEGITISPDKQSFVMAINFGDAFYVAKWDINNQHESWINKTNKWAYDIDINDNNKYIVAVTWDCSIYIWETIDGKVFLDDMYGWDQWNYKYDKTCFFTVKFIDNNTFVTGSADDSGGIIRVFDIVEKKCIQEIKACEKIYYKNEYVSAVHDLAVLKNKKVLISGGTDGILKFWKINDENKIEIFHSLDIRNFKAIQNELMQLKKGSHFTHRLNLHIPSYSISKIIVSPKEDYIIVGFESGLIIRVDIDDVLIPINI
jgi:WD40 repeat protein